MRTPVVPRYQPALKASGPGASAAQHGARINVGSERGDGPNGIGGHTEGAWVQSQNQIGTGLIVSAENIGNPVLGLILPTGNPNAVGAEPGASGAQLSGIERQDHPPNPHPSPRTTSSIFELIASTFQEVSPPISILPLLWL